MEDPNKAREDPRHVAPVKFERKKDEETLRGRAAFDVARRRGDLRDERYGRQRLNLEYRLGGPKPPLQGVDGQWRPDEATRKRPSGSLGSLGDEAWSRALRSAPEWLAKVVRPEAAGPRLPAKA